MSEGGPPASSLGRRLFYVDAPSASSSSWSSNDCVAHDMEVDLDRFLDDGDNQLAVDFFGTPPKRIRDDLSQSNFVSTRLVLSAWAGPGASRGFLDDLLRLPDDAPVSMRAGDDGSFECTVDLPMSPDESSFSSSARDDFASAFEPPSSSLAAPPAERARRLLLEEESWRRLGVQFEYEIRLFHHDEEGAARRFEVACACLAARLGAAVPVLSAGTRWVGERRRMVVVRVRPKTCLFDQLMRACSAFPHFPPDDPSVDMLLLDQTQSWQHCVQALASVGVLHLGLTGLNLLQGAMPHPELEHLFVAGETYVHSFRDADVFLVNVDAYTCNAVMNTLLLLDLCARDVDCELDNAVASLAEIFAQIVAWTIATRTERSLPTRRFLALMDACWQTLFPNAVHETGVPPSSSSSIARREQADETAETVVDAQDPVEKVVSRERLGTRMLQGLAEEAKRVRPSRAPPDDDVSEQVERVHAELRRARLSRFAPVPPRSDVELAVRTTLRLYDAVRRVASTRGGPSQGAKEVRTWCSRVPCVKSALELAGACMHKLAYEPLSRR